jgi:hypothetical protein
MTDSTPERPKTKRVNLKQGWADAIWFVLQECARFQELLQEAARTNQLSSLPKEDLLYELKTKPGRHLICGREAHRRLLDAVIDAHGRSGIARTISVDRLFKAVQRLIVERFIDGEDEVSLGKVDSLFAAAVRQVRAAGADSTHYIPCQLMYVADPDHFSVGPVTFHNRETFTAIGERLARERGEKHGDRDESIMRKVLKHYEYYSWVAEVTIRGCDKEIGQERATLAVNAAVDFLRLLFGHHHSRKMSAAGPPLESEIGATIELRDGETEISYSIGATSAVGFEKGWAAKLNDLGPRELAAAAGRAIEAITDPSIERPLGLRLLDAASWHGQAVREVPPAAAIVKSVTALERLVTVRKTTNATVMVCERSAAMSYDPTRDERFDALLARIGSIYDLRSRLAHGMLSPFGPEVRRRRAEVLAAVEKSLVNGLALFDQDQLLDRPLNRRQLDSGLNALVSWARRIDADKAARHTGHGEASPEG